MEPSSFLRRRATAGCVAELTLLRSAALGTPAAEEEDGVAVMLRVRVAFTSFSGELIFRSSRPPPACRLGLPCCKKAAAAMAAGAGSGSPESEPEGSEAVESFG